MKDSDLHMVFFVHIYVSLQEGNATLMVGLVWMSPFSMVLHVREGVFLDVPLRGKTGRDDTGTKVFFRWKIHGCSSHNLRT